MSTAEHATTSVPQKATFGAKRVAQLISVALAAGAGAIVIFAPLYQVASSDSDGNSSTGTATMLEIVGPWALVLVLIPIAAALAPLVVPVGMQKWVTIAATILFAGWVVVGVWTIGGFYAPAFVCLLSSVFIRPRSSSEV